MRDPADMDTAEIRQAMAVLLYDLRQRERELYELRRQYTRRREAHRRRRRRLGDLRRELVGR